MQNAIIIVILDFFFLSFLSMMPSVDSVPQFVGQAASIISAGASGSSLNPANAVADNGSNGEIDEATLMTWVKDEALAQLDSEQQAHAQTRVVLDETKLELVQEEQKHEQTRGALIKTESALTGEKQAHTNTRTVLIKTKSALKTEQSQHEQTRDVLIKTKTALKSEKKQHHRTRVVLDKTQTELSGEKHKSRKLQTNLSQERKQRQRTESSLRHERNRLNKTLLALNQVETGLHKEREQHGKTKGSLNKTTEELDKIAQENQKTQAELVQERQKREQVEEEKKKHIGKIESDLKDVRSEVDDLSDVLGSMGISPKSGHTTSWQVRKHAVRQLEVLIREEDTLDNDDKYLSLNLPAVRASDGSTWLVGEFHTLGFAWREIIKDGDITELRITVSNDGSPPQRMTEPLKCIKYAPPVCLIRLPGAAGETAKPIGIKALRARPSNTADLFKAGSDEGTEISYSITNTGWLAINTAKYIQNMAIAPKRGDYLMTRDGLFIGVMVSDKRAYVLPKSFQTQIGYDIRISGPQEKYYRDFVSDARRVKRAR